MEENKVVSTIDEGEEIVEPKKGVLSKVGSGLKKHWKTVAVGAGALLVGAWLGSRSHHSDGYVDADYEVEEEDETEEA